VHFMLFFPFISVEIAWTTCMLPSLISKSCAMELGHRCFWSVLLSLTQTAVLPTEIWTRGRVLNLYITLLCLCQQPCPNPKRSGYGLSSLSWLNLLSMSWRWPIQITMPGGQSEAIRIDNKPPIPVTDAHQCLLFLSLLREREWQMLNSWMAVRSQVINPSDRCPN
jgi:hypothetical protein